MRSKPTPLEIEGTTYQLIYDFNVMVDCEEETGLNLLNAQGHLAEMTASEFRALFYTALKPAQPKMTLKDAGNLIRIERIGLITSALADMYFTAVKEQLEAIEKASE